MVNRRFWAGTVAAFIALGVTAPVAAQDDAAMEQAISALERSLGGELLNNPYTTKWGTEGKGVRGKLVETDGLPGGVAFQAATRKAYNDVWEARVVVPLEKDIRKGDVIQVSAYIRTDKAPKGRSGKVDLQIVRTKEPYDNVMSETLNPGDEWQLYTVTGTAGSNFDMEDTVFGVNIGHAKQAIQFGSVYIVRKSSGS